MHKLTFALAVLCAPAAALAAPPQIIDSVGARETWIRAFTYPPTPPNPGTWAPELVLFVQFDDHAPEDVLVVDWREGKKSLAKPLACQAMDFVKEVRAVPSRGDSPVHAVNVARFECRFPKEASISRAGRTSLELTYRQTLAGKETPLGTLEVEAIEIFQGAQAKPTRTFATNLDHLLGPAFVGETQGGESGHDEVLRGELSRHVAGGAENHHLFIWFYTKYARPKGLSMSCLLGDKRIGEAGSVKSVGGDGKSYWSHKGKGRVEATYTGEGFLFLRTFTGKAKVQNPNQFFLGDNPGEYRCVAMADGAIVKEVYFTVGEDGKIAGNACDEAVRLLGHFHVARSKDVAISDVPVDGKAGRRAFFGRVAWPAGCPPR
jgi:hypothetical protein